jgi:hypothetical protein
MVRTSLDGTSSAGATGGQPYKALWSPREGGVLVSYFKSLYSTVVAAIHAHSRSKAYVYIFNFTIVPHLPKRVRGRHKEVYIRGPFIQEISLITFIPHI